MEEALDDESDSDTEMEVVTKAGDAKAKVKHDIVMKPETGKKQSGFFKSNKSKYPMYPCVEEKIKYDDYGEIIRIEDFLMDTSEPVDDLAEVVEEYEEDVHDKEEVPTKCVSTVQNFQINCGIQSIDFEGRTDGESIMKPTAQLKPRRMILVRGSEEYLTALKDFCSDVIGGENNIFVPKNGEVVDATTERFIYQVRLRDSLFSTLNFNKAKDGHLAWVDGVIKMTDDERVDIIATDVDDDSAEPTAPAQPVIPVLDPLPDDQVVGHSTNFVNELKLSDFKLVLTKNGRNTNISYLCLMPVCP